MRRALALSALLFFATIALPAQSTSAAAPEHVLIPLPNAHVPPELIELVKLEESFQQSVAKGGGRAFASWFAKDGVTLNNGQPAVLGQTAIAAHAQWDPKQYQLSWYVEGAQMGPSKDTAFTWGHYDATTMLADGKQSTSSGRYITFWKKVDGEWKVALDASADEPATPDVPSVPLPSPH
jgi:ketosteroid isomerase-like protein